MFKTIFTPPPNVRFQYIASIPLETALALDIIESCGYWSILQEWHLSVWFNPDLVPCMGCDNI